MKNQAIFFMGPTAAGKTALAMQLAQNLPVDLISVDSAMVYRGLDIGTGKPSRAELAAIPQQLIDIRDPIATYSAAQFCDDATEAMQNSWDQNRIPLLVGGTMLYFKALQFGLAEMPSANQELRNELAQQTQQFGLHAMHARLATLDPTAAQRISCNDPQRIQRALEVNILTGKTLDQLYQQQNKPQLNYNLQTFALIPEDRAALHQTIANRFMQMLDQGLINEVTALYNRADLTADLPAIRSVGYNQVWQYLEGKINYETMCAQAIAATRQLAKRQYTWLRSWPKVVSFNNSDAMVLDTIINSVLDSVNN